MNWQAKIFAYCERGRDLGFWAEPVNALTNVAFIVAALLALREWIKLKDRDVRRIEFALIAVVFGIGIGSFLFHTMATRWAALADVLPITVFMLAYLAYALVRFIRLAWTWAAVAVGVFFLSLPAAGLISAGGGGGLFAGSASYLPALLVLAAVGGTLRKRHHPAGTPTLMGAAIFAVSLTLRTFDQAACGWTSSFLPAPLGTHFVWHILNAVLLYTLLGTALRHGAKNRV